MAIILNGTSGIITPGITNTGPFIFEGPVTVPAGTASSPSVSFTGSTNTGLYLSATGAVSISTAGTQRVVVNASGNVGVGVTPSAWDSGRSAIQLGGTASYFVGNSVVVVSANNFFDGSNNKYVGNGFANQYAQSSGSHIWLNAASGTAGNTITFTQAMTLDASGNLLVGTTSIASGFSGFAQIEASGSTGGVLINSATGNIGRLIFTNNNTSGNEGLIRYDGSNQSMQFWTSAVERARITSGGAFLIATTSNANNVTLNVGGTLEASGSGKSYIYGAYAQTVGATNRDVYVDDTGALGYVSSIRSSKTNIQNINDISWLLKLVPVSFNYRKKDEEGNRTNEAESPIEFGLIAEDVETIKPELCFYDKVDGKQELRGVSYSKLITPMLKLIQEQQAIIEQLKADVAALKGAN